MSHSAGTMPVMHTLELWRWRVTDPVSGQRHTTRYVMTKVDALAADPTAEHVPGSLELRPVPDSPSEYMMTDGWRRGAQG